MSKRWNRSEEMQSDDMSDEKGCKFIIHSNLCTCTHLFCLRMSCHRCNEIKYTCIWYFCCLFSFLKTHYAEHFIQN